MRQMTYTRKLDYDGYVVHGYNGDFRDCVGDADFKPIQMKLAKAGTTYWKQQIQICLEIWIRPISPKITPQSSKASAQIGN